MESKILSGFEIVPVESLRDFGMYIAVSLSTRGNKVVATAQVVDQYGSVVSQYGAIHSKPFPLSAERTAKNAVCQKLADAVLATQGREPCTMDHLRAALAKEKADAKGSNGNGNPLGNAKTRLRIITYFERNILDFLGSYLDPAKSELTDEIREDLIKTLINKTHTRTEASVPREVVLDHLRDADRLLDRLPLYDKRIPSLKLTPSCAQNRSPKVEQLKSLPREVLTAFYEAVEKLADKDPRLAFFAVLVIFGLRPAEAAGANPSDITFFDKYCTVAVTSQEEDGQLTDRLKREESRRIVVISYWGRCLLKKCVDAIGENYPTDGTAMNSAQACSKAIKQLLLEQCQVTNERRDELVNEIESAYPPQNDPKKQQCQSDTVACYILRRIFAGIARSIMGLTMFETDRLLGHVPDRQHALTVCSLDMNSQDVQASIAQKMERYIFTSTYSLNPAVTPYRLQDGSILDVIPFTECHFINATAHALTIDVVLTASETGECIEIDCPEGSVLSAKATSAKKTWESQNRLVIGDTTPPRWHRHSGRSQKTI